MSCAWHCNAADRVRAGAIAMLDQIEVMSYPDHGHAVCPGCSQLACRNGFVCAGHIARIARRMLATTVAFRCLCEALRTLARPLDSRYELDEDADRVRSNHASGSAACRSALSLAWHRPSPAAARRADISGDRAAQRSIAVHLPTQQACDKFVLRLQTVSSTKMAQSCACLNRHSVDSVILALASRSQTLTSD